MNKKSYPSVYNLQFLQQNMSVIPVPFEKHQRYVSAFAKK